MKVYRENNKDRLKEKRKKWEESHRAQQIEYYHQYYLTHHEEALKIQRLYYKNHKKQAADWYKEYYQNHRDKRIQDYKQGNQQIKREVLTYYGNGKLACVKCGCDDVRALTIDHINGGGEIHRKAIGTRPMYRWLKNNNLPLGFQTLCNNCNFVKKIINGEIGAYSLNAEFDKLSKPERTQQKNTLRALVKFKVLSHYGGGIAKCVKCGFDDIRALTIDHINGGGSKHRKIMKHAPIYPWLVSHGYPEGYQTLCANCNLIKRITSTMINIEKKELVNEIS